jgi:hypothetical protein
MLTIAGVALLLGAGILLPSAQAAPLLHGTPDPNATPQVNGDDHDHPVTYYQDIKPIIEANCLGCHVAGAIGGERLLLDDPAIVQEFAEEIAFTTGTRYMPPWMPGPLSAPLRHNRSLSEADMALFDAWFGQGAPLGDPTQAAATVRPTSAPFEADLTIQLAEPYTPNADLNDDYRCFLLDPQLEESTFIRGYVADPDQASIVHHILVFKITEAQVRQAQRLDDRTEGAGWQCFGSSGVGDDTVIGAWAPGTEPVIHPDGFGYPFNKGDQIIVQVHYFLDAGPKPDQSRVLFDLADPGEELEPLYTAGLTAPVEIPCPAEVQTPECQRQAAIEYSRQYYDDADSFFDNFLLDCGKTPEDYLTQDAANVTSDCEFESPFDAMMVDILPHMHTRGTSIRLEINPDQPNSQIAIDIPRWDFHWQGVYQFVEPIAIQRGDTIRITCTWDNTRDPNPRYILWGEGTQDEMCLTYFTVYLP